MQPGEDDIHMAKKQWVTKTGNPGPVEYPPSRECPRASVDFYELIGGTGDKDIAPAFLILENCVV